MNNTCVDRVLLLILAASFEIHLLYAIQYIDFGGPSMHVRRYATVFRTFNMQYRRGMLLPTIFCLFPKPPCPAFEIKIESSHAESRSSSSDSFVLLWQDESELVSLDDVSRKILCSEIKYTRIDVVP